MELQETKQLTALAIVNPSLSGELTRYFGMQTNSNVRIMMHIPTFDLLTAEQMLKATAVDIVFVDSNVDNFNSSDFLTLRQRSATPLLLVGLAFAGADTELLMHSNFDAVYSLPLSETVITRMNTELPEKLNNIKGDWHKGAWDAVTPNEIREVVSQSASDWQKAIISVWSAKGGAGKSTVAVELASTLAGIGGRNVCLLDTNLNGGHVRMRLNIRSEHSIVSVASMYTNAMKNSKDWASAQKEITEEMDKYLLPVPGSTNINGKSNFYVIPGITTQEQARSPYLQGKEVVDFMSFLCGDYLKQRFDFVVIDVGSSVNVPLHRESFRNSDTILVVCDPDSSGIADNQKTVKKILAPQIPIEKFSLVLNRWKEDVGISIQDVSDLMGITVRGFIPDDYLGGVIKSANSGRSYIVGNNRKADNPIATERTMQGFVNIAATFYPPVGAAWAARASSVNHAAAQSISMNKPQKPKEKKSLFKRLFG